MDYFHQSSILVLILALLSTRSLSMRYELNSGQTKCISEDIHEKAMSVGKYFVVNPNDDSHPLPSSHKITVKVLAMEGSEAMHEAVEVGAGQFAFTATHNGSYIACVSAIDYNPKTVLTIDFEWRTGVHSVHSKDWSKVAKKSQIVMMEFSVKDLLETVNSISEEMFYLRDREQEMQELNRSTNSKMAWLSLLSLGVCLSVAGLQFWHLKTFFEKKKLI